jgi:hypothetical protein
VSAPLVATATADQVVVSSDHAPGPAGLVVVHLLGGDATLAVDTIEPATLVSIALSRPLGDAERRVAHRVLGAPHADAVVRWAGPAGSGRPRVVDPPVLPLPGTQGRGDPGRGRVTTIAAGPLPLLGRLALGLEELTRAGLTDPHLALGLVDLGVLALDLTPGLDPDPAGLVLAVAGIERWELVGPDGWDDAGPDLLAATARRSVRWHKSLFAADPSLAGRLEVLMRSRPNRSAAGAGATTGTGRARHHGLPVAGPPASAPPATVAAAPVPGAGPIAAERAATTAPPAIEVAFAPDLDGRLISAERDDHHLVVHLGGLGDRPGWLRVYRAGSPPRLLALAPVVETGRPWRTAVALIGPEVATGDLLVDVTDAPSEPWRSPATRRTERAGHLGREAARITRRAAGLGRSAGREGRAGAEVAWQDCARAWDDAGDPVRADQAREYATDPPVPPWALSDPLLTDL